MARCPVSAGLRRRQVDTVDAVVISGIYIASTARIVVHAILVVIVGVCLIIRAPLVVGAFTGAVGPISVIIVQLM
eukprot:scaffold504537_cov20-Prasinocladus_malaysianus.AAC.1